MITLEFTGKSIDEAIEKALSELQVSREDVEVEIIEEGSRGFLGLIGSKEAKVKVIKKMNAEEIAKEFLYVIAEKMKVAVDFEITKNQDTIHINAVGKNIGILIGRRGETLESIQYLTNLAVQKKIQDRIKIIFDVEGYRNRREQTLIKLANRLYEKARKSNKNIVLEPMNPHERRIIHTALQNKQGIHTYSEGNEPYRKVVISVKR